MHGVIRWIIATSVSQMLCISLLAAINFSVHRLSHAGMHVRYLFQS